MDSSWDFGYECVRVSDARILSCRKFMISWEWSWAGVRNPKGSVRFRVSGLYKDYVGVMQGL